MKRLSLLLLLIGIICMSWAAIDEYYTFSASTGTYTPITGTPITSILDDDAISEAIPIGFTFSYGDNSYTDLKVSSNGWIGLGTSQTGSNLSNALTSTSTVPVLAPLWDDLSMEDGAVQYLLEGTAPNRIFTIQYSAVSWNYSGNTDYNFQVKLSESGKVEFLYGSGTGTPNNPSASIGINMLPGGTGWLYSVTPGTPATASSTTEFSSIATIPDNGTIYSFNPVIASSIDLAALSITGSATPSIGTATPYTITIRNRGTIAQDTYMVKLFNSNNVELASVNGPAIAFNEVLPVVINWTPTTEGAASIYGKIVLPSDQNTANDQTANLNITVMPQGIMAVTIGDGSQTARLPMDMYYKNSVYQTLYYPDEIAMFGIINAVTLYNQFTTTTLMNMPTKIWMGSTTQMDLSAGWIPSTAMSLVFDSTVNYPGGENTIVIPLTTPFTYTGGNLVIMWNRPMDTQYYSSSDYFKCQTVGTNRARILFSDTTTYDPATVTGGTLTGQFPKTTLTLTPMTTDPIFSVTPDGYSFGEVFISGTASQTFTIRNVGGGTLQIDSITLAGSPTFSLANLPTLPVSLTTGQASTFSVNFSPNGGDTYIGIVNIVDNLTARSQFGLNSASNRDRTPHQVPLTGTGVSDIMVGTGTVNARMPIDMFYKNSLYETLIYPAEMSNFMGMILGIKLFNQFTTDLTAMPTKIWMGTTTQADLSAGWIPSTELTQVFDGTVNYPSGTNTITITFPQPYLYLNGQNLVMMFNRPMDTEYYSSADYFKCQTMGTTRARNVFSDTTTYDPTAPGDVGTVTGTFPKITFVVTPGNIGSITGTILGAGSAPLPDVAVNVANRDYNATTDNNGQFTISLVLPANYTVTLSKHGYVTHTQNIVVEEEETEVINVTMTPMATVSVSGNITGSDTGNGLSGATISLTGYENYTATTTATGAFNIPSAYANQTYSYVILCPGYTTVNGEINVGATNHNIGTITLTEIAYAPYSVVADLDGPQNNANIHWLAPDPTAVDITESFEETAFPPSTWSQVITNTAPANATGIFPTWCSFGTTNFNSNPAAPADGAKQAGLWWDYEHQDEWLITPAFNCPPAAYLRFSTWCFRGSDHGDHYYVKLSTDGGNQWLDLWDASTLAGGYTTSAMLVSLDLTEFSGQQIKLAWHAEDPATDDGLWYGWFIDNILIGNPTTTLTFTPQQLSTKSASPSKRSNIDSPGLSRAAVQNGYRSEPVRLEPIVSNSISTSTRTLSGYKVWRLLQGQEGNENAWTLLTPNLITGLAFVDTGYGSAPHGIYLWAVKAVYTAGVTSVPAFSNSIVGGQYGNVVGVVRKPNTQPLAGATISAGGLNATTNSVGAYSLTLFVGTYEVTCSATGYQTQTMEDVQVVADQNTTLNFNMIVTDGADPEIPVVATALLGNHPNPFNPETTISYDIKEACDVRLEIYNLKGQRVRSLVNAAQNNGTYRIVFNSRDDKGNALSSGIYLYRLTAGEYSSTRKMMLME